MSSASISRSLPQTSLYSNCNFSSHWVTSLTPNPDGDDRHCLYQGDVAKFVCQMLDSGLDGAEGPNALQLPHASGDEPAAAAHAHPATVGLHKAPETDVYRGHMPNALPLPGNPSQLETVASLEYSELRISFCSFSCCRTVSFTTFMFSNLVSSISLHAEPINIDHECKHPLTDATIIFWWCVYSRSHPISLFSLNLVLFNLPPGAAYNTLSLHGLLAEQLVLLL